MAVRREQRAGGEAGEAAYSGCQGPVLGVLGVLGVGGPVAVSRGSAVLLAHQTIGQGMTEHFYSKGDFQEEGEFGKEEKRRRRPAGLGRALERGGEQGGQEGQARWPANVFVLAMSRGHEGTPLTHVPRVP